MHVQGCCFAREPCGVFDIFVAIAVVVGASASLFSDCSELKGWKQTC